jgi:hypothetical protein
MTTFSKLPQDMLQHEINRYLDPNSRGDFNAVLKSSERVYKKFPTDYALKHAILTAHKTCRTIVSELYYNLENIGGGIVDSRGVSFERKSVKCLRRLFAFFKNPHNSVIFMYISDLKDISISLITSLTESNLDLYYRLDSCLVADLKTEAASVLAYVATITNTGLSMTLTDYKSIY